jgi:hypothetical protein
MSARRLAGSSKIGLEPSAPHRQSLPFAPATKHPYRASHEAQDPTGRVSSQPFDPDQGCGSESRIVSRACRLLWFPGGRENTERSRSPGGLRIEFAPQVIDILVVERRIP